MSAEETMPEEDKKIVHRHAIVDGVDVKIDGVKDVTVNEIKNYLEVIAKNIPDESRLTTLTISKADEDAKNVALDYKMCIRDRPMIVRSKRGKSAFPRFGPSLPRARTCLHANGMRPASSTRYPLPSLSKKRTRCV